MQIFAWIVNNCPMRCDSTQISLRQSKYNGVDFWKNWYVKASTHRIHAACRTVTGRMTSASSLTSRSLTFMSIWLTRRENIHQKTWRRTSPCHYGTYAKEALVIGLQHTFRHPRPMGSCPELCSQRRQPWAVSPIFRSYSISVEQCP